MTGMVSGLLDDDASLNAVGRAQLCVLLRRDMTGKCAAVDADGVWPHAVAPLVGAVLEVLTATFPHRLGSPPVP